MRPAPTPSAMFRSTGAVLAAMVAAVAAVAAASVLGLPAAHARAAASPTAAGVVPKPFNVESTLRIDLDGDGDLDEVLVGVDGPARAPETLEDNAPDGNRVLVVARKDADGFRRVGLGGDALECRRCGGAFWGGVPAPVELAASGGGFTTMQTAGAREVTDWTHRYRLEGARVRLIGLDRVNTDRAGGSVVTRSTNLLTGVTVTSVDGQPEEPVRAGTVRSKPRIVFLEAVKLS